MNDELRTLGEDYWEYLLAQRPTQAFMIADHRYDDRMEDASRAAEDAQIARLRDFARRAEAIDPAGLDADERTSREVLVFEASTTADRLEARFAELAVNNTVGDHVLWFTVAPQLPVTEPEHADALVAKYHELGRYFRQKADRLREGISAGRTPPALQATKVVEQIDEYLASPLDHDPYLQARTPAAFDEARTAAWREELAAAVRDHIRPAYGAYRDTVADEVLPHARTEDRCGLGWLPDGEESYRKAIHAFTSVPLEAQEVHRIGLDTIEALGAEYRVLGKEVLGTQDLETIYARLRDDPELHFTDGPAIVAASEAALAKARDAMGAWFGRLPQADCFVQETPTGPIAFYFPPAADGSRPGTFFVNTADPAHWGRHEIEPMAYHEGIPGHHLQLAIAQELTDLPEFRKYASVVAYSEGWGLYTERLADEMGLYGGPLDRLGMLAADSMRASRLVVDTGIHAMGWSRQQAIDYMAANTPMTAGSITSEVDRYIGYPGQALAYMIGRREIVRMRAEARTALGDRFDIKGFHDTVLGSGAVPLPVLERLVADWAASPA